MGVTGCDSESSSGGQQQGPALDGGGPDAADPDAGVADAALVDAAADAALPDAGEPEGMQVRPGVETVTVTGVEGGALISLYGPDGERMVSMRADAAGQAHFAYIPAEYTVLESGLGADIPVLGGTTLKAGDGYVIRDETTRPVVESAPFRVLAVADVPDVSLYESQTLHGIVDPLISNVGDQDVNEGFNYITMRDGVKLG
ncbi:MAG: hypothetical protein R3F43_26710 [bacterium]